VLLNAKTGEPPVELSSEDVQTTSLNDFSHDGRLLIGSVSKDGGAMQTVVWDTTTGKVVKTWSAGTGRRASGLAIAFAPNGYSLAVSEVESTPVYGPSNAIPQGFRPEGGQQWTTQREIIRTDYKTVIGIWDLSSLVK
jgi:WD40 repeat protein